jgi:hypothetical protein
LGSKDSVFELHFGLIGDSCPLVLVNQAQIEWRECIGLDL